MSIIAPFPFRWWQVTFDENIDMVYDNAPRLSITGSGFDTLDASNMKLSFAPPIKDGDYDIEIYSSTFMSLSLKEGKKWVVENNIISR